MKIADKTIADEIRDIANSENVPVLGIGPAAALAGEPPGYRPHDLLPGAQSLICFGIPVPRGVYRSFPFGTETIWRSQNLYYRRLDTLSVRFAALLEDSGAQAIPVFGCFPMTLNGKGDVAGYLNLIHMGEATRTGTIGRNGLLIHSRYGARLMLGGIVTSADLPAFRRPDLDEPGCPPNCHVCADACPVQAISAERKRVNIMQCLSYTARTPLMSKIKFLVLRSFRPSSAARLMNLTSLDEHTLHICSQCVALCPYGMEQSLCVSG